MNHRYRNVLSWAGLTVAMVGLTVLHASSVRAQGQALRLTGAGSGQAREFTVAGHQFAFSRSKIEVQKDDLVKITFTAVDIAHSFTINEYRIAKRAGAGQTVVFEFRADQAGTFTFYCNLSQDDRCKEMKGQLVVN